MSSEYLASSLKIFRGHSILNHTPVLCSTFSWVKICGSPLNHKNHKMFTIQYIVCVCIVPLHCH